MYSVLTPLSAFFELFSYSLAQGVFTDVACSDPFPFFSESTSIFLWKPPLPHSHVALMMAMGRYQSLIAGVDTNKPQGFIQGWASEISPWEFCWGKGCFICTDVNQMVGSEPGAAGSHPATMWGSLPQNEANPQESKVDRQRGRTLMASFLALHSAIPENPDSLLEIPSYRGHHSCFRD